MAARVFCTCNLLLYIYTLIQYVTGYTLITIDDSIDILSYV